MSKEDQAKPQAPIVRPLNAEEREDLEAGLNLASELAAAPRPLSLDRVQRLYDRLLSQGIDNGDETIALGLAFGETMLSDDAFVWARVEDVYGTETCVAATHHVVYAGPISMLQKRLERREPVALAELRKAILEMMNEQIATAKRR